MSRPVFGKNETHKSEYRWNLRFDKAAVRLGKFARLRAWFTPMIFDGRVYWNNITHHSITLSYVVPINSRAPSPQFLGSYQHEGRKERLGTKKTVVSFVK
jgi:hypothetical protein